MRSRLAATLLALSAFAIAGCGDDDDPAADTDTGGGGGEAPALLDSVPAGPFPSAVSLDFEEARARLGVDPGIEFRDAILSDDAGEKAYAQAVGVALRWLALPQVTPLGEAIEVADVTEAAGNTAVGEDSVTLLRTDQDFGEIASSLESKGWERDGDVVTDPGASFAEGGSAVAAVDGVVAVGFSPEVVSAAAAGETADPVSEELRSLISELDAPLAAAVEGSECLQAIGIADEFEPPTARMVFLDDEAGAEKVTVDDSELTGPQFEFSEPEAGDGRVEVKVSRAVPELGISPASLIQSDIPAGALYSC